MFGVLQNKVHKKIKLKHVTLLSFITLTVLLLSSQITYSQLVSDFRVNDDTTDTRQYNSCISASDNGNFVVLWADGRAGIQDNWNLYFQRYNASGKPIGHNVFVNTGGTHPQALALEVRRDGSFIVAWADTLCRMRIYDSTGSTTGSEIILSNLNLGTQGVTDHAISVSTNREGKIFAAMSIFIESYHTFLIYCQRLDKYGNKIGGIVQVNELITLGGGRRPSITVRDDSSFIITWEDANNNGWDDIYMQMYDSSGTKIGNNRKINDDTFPENIQRDPSVSSDSTGRFIIVWADPRIDNGSLYSTWTQAFNPDGSLNGVNFEADPFFGVNKTKPKVRKRRDGYFIVGWTYYTFNEPTRKPQCQRFNALNQKIGTDFNISKTAVDSAIKYFSDFAFVNDKIISVWEDSRSGSDLTCDIYCNIISFVKPDSIVGVNNISTIIPDNYILYQNYPNPFNPITNVKFSIIKAGQVKLIVYDIQGREVETLVNESLKPGTYESTFNGSNYPSGIYFYKLISDGFTESKKMLMIK
jgi:hypothetical protein